MVPIKPTVLQRILTFEPTLARAIVMTVVLVAGLVGLNLTEVGDAVVTGWTAIFALFPLIQGWWTRPAVTANAKVEIAKEEDGTLIAGPASPLPDGTVITDLVTRSEA